MKMVYRTGIVGPWAVMRVGASSETWIHAMGGAYGMS
jgi:hypothetical protein